MTVQTLMWLAFTLLVVIMLIIDLGLSRRSHEVSFREALAWSGVWITLALIFNAGIYHFLGETKALEFFTGYVIEKSLSVDNLFVFIMIFSYFRIPRLYQPKILKWGIIGALVMRAVFILAGIELLETFHWMIYIFGGILVFTGIRMAFGSKDVLDPANFEATYDGMMALKKESGQPLGVRATHLVVGATNASAGRKIVEAQLINGGDSNTNFNRVKLIECPWLP